VPPAVRTEMSKDYLRDIFKYQGNLSYNSITLQLNRGGIPLVLYRFGFLLVLFGPSTVLFMLIGLVQGNKDESLLSKAWPGIIRRNERLMVDPPGSRLPVLHRK
jgi:hypothetical protein